MWQRPQQIMSRLAKNFKVLYIDHFRAVPVTGVLNLTLEDRLTKIHDNLYVYSPGHVNRSSLIHSLRRLYLNLDIEKPVLWLYYPTVVPILGELDYSLLCYDCVDDFSEFSWNPSSFGTQEAKLMELCDLIFVTSERLKKAKEAHAKEVFLVPNAADVEHFEKATKDDCIVPEEINRIGKPVIGFVGAIYEWIDLELIEKVCRARPLWSFVMVGPVSNRVRMPKGLKNLYITGKRSYYELPNIIKAFDVCMIPFKINKLTESTNPVKLYEYLAAGKPVVSTPIPEILKFKDIVKTAGSPQGFVKAIEECILSDSPEQVEKRLGVARENSWEKRIEVMEGIIKTKLHTS